jgi:hypothetical protein
LAGFLRIKYPPNTGRDLGPSLFLGAHHSLRLPPLCLGYLPFSSIVLTIVAVVVTFAMRGTKSSSLEEPLVNSYNILLIHSVVGSSWRLLLNYIVRIFV